MGGAVFHFLLTARISRHICDLCWFGGVVGVVFACAGSEVGVDVGGRYDALVVVLFGDTSVSLT